MAAPSPTETGVLCRLCGLDCGPDPYPDGSHRFCCLGCLNVYAILRESGALEGGRDPRETELFRRSREMGLVSTRPSTPAPSAPAPSADCQERLYHVSGLWCASCAWLIEHTMLRQPGVVSAEVFFTSDLLKLRFEPQRFPAARVPELLHGLGYQGAEYSEPAAFGDAARKDLLLRLGIAAFFWLNVMGLNLSVYLGAFDSMPPSARRMLPLMAMALSLPVLLYSARPILHLAWRGLLQGVLRMESLLAAGILMAFLYSTIEGLRGGTHIYFDIACAITTLVLLGKSIEQGAKRSATETIAGLHRMLPRKARLLNGRFAALEALQPGETFLVKAGERVPCDGVVLEGFSQADESLLTGESAPVAKPPGSAVAAGSLNLSGVLTVQATTIGGQSTIGQIVTAVERALASRSELERKVDRVSRIFVPVVMAVAVAVAAWWFLSGLPLAEALLRGITVLVIACPCALGIATPLALTAAVGAASRAGILVRDAGVLEHIRRIDAVILDKTGTVTEDGFALLHADPAHLALLASLEQFSEHPLGRATVKLATAQGVELLPATGIEILRGQGIRGRTGERAVTIGTASLFPALPARFAAHATAQEELGHTVAYYSIDGAVSGVLVYGSRLRAEAQELVDGLRRRGVRVLLVSGDSHRTTGYAAASLGLAESIAAATPTDKAHLVDRLRERGYTVAVVGDGINDAPALAHADLGIALGSGADLAMRAASMVLIGGRLTRVLTAFDLSTRTHRVVLQNLFWAFAYNVAGIAMAAAGWLNPIVAAAAMVFSSVSVVVNSYRLSRTS